MVEAPCNPRVLVVTPEVTYLPDRMGGLASFFTAKAGGLADVSAALVTALFEQGADVHVAIPDYRAIFSDGLAPVLKKEFSKIRRRMPDDRIHLAEDRAFYYVNRVYSDYGTENIKLALAFQREVINNIIPYVQPDLIHCNDWMTGLIPAMARQVGIPCLFTVHNVHTVKTTLEFIEDRGIDAAYFWQNLYFENMADHYEAARENNPVFTQVDPPAARVRGSATGPGGGGSFALGNRKRNEEIRTPSGPIDPLGVQQASFGR